MSNPDEGNSRDGVSDEALVELALGKPESAQSREAASELFRRYRRRVYGWCYRYVHDHERAMDLAQDILLRGYRNLSAFRGTARFSSWLFAIARNRCFNDIRRPSLIDEGSFHPDRVIGSHPTPEEELVEKLDEEAILGLIQDRLDPREQEVLWLRCFERMPIEMITEAMRVEEASGARGLLQRARRKLRGALEEKKQDKGPYEGPEMSPDENADRSPGRSAIKSAIKSANKSPTESRGEGLDRSPRMSPDKSPDISPEKSPDGGKIR